MIIEKSESEALSLHMAIRPSFITQRPTQKEGHGKLGTHRAKIVAWKHLDEPATRVGRIADRSLGTILCPVPNTLLRHDIKYSDYLPRFIIVLN